MYAKELALAWAKVQSGLKQEEGGRQLWLEGTYELMQNFDKERLAHESDIEFGHWCDQNGPPISRHDRAALINMALYPETTREILEQTHCRSYDYIWKKFIQPHPNVAKLRLPRTRQPPVIDNEPTTENPVVTKSTRRPKKTKAEQIREYNEATGFKIVKFSVRKAKPIGRMPDDIKEQYEKELGHLFAKLEKIYQLGRYSDQMSEELRHYLAGGLNKAKVRLEQMAKDMLGGDGDLRKIRKPACGDDIPVRLDENASTTTLQ
jgi:hypothetical protein